MPKRESSWLHLLAVVLGIVAAIFIGLAILLWAGYVTPSLIDGITLAECEAYGGLAVVGAVASEIGAREV